MGPLDEAQHPASIETSAPRMQSADCSLPGGLQQMRRFPNCRVFLFLVLLLLLSSCFSSVVSLPAWSLVPPPPPSYCHITVTAHRVSTCAPNLATFVGLAIHAIPRPQ